MPKEDVNRFAVLNAPGSLKWREEPLAPVLPRADYVRIKVAYAALCGSDLSFFQGRPHAEYPRTIGHEYFGTVVLAGPEAIGFGAGDLVAVDPNYRCGQCLCCKMGASNLCEFGDINLFTGRGFSRYVDIHCAYLHHIPHFEPPYLGALIEPLSCALHALELAQVKDDDRVLLLGAGGQGSLLAFALSRIFPTAEADVFDPNRERSRKVASAFSSNVKELSQAPGEARYPLVLEASGQSLGFAQAASSAAKGGRIIVISRYHNQPPAFFPEEFPNKECAVRFSHLYGDGQPFARAIELLSEGWKRPLSDLFQVRPLMELDQLFQQGPRSPYCKTILEIDSSF